MKPRGDEIVVWTVALDGDVGPDCLSPEEHERAHAAVDPCQRRRRVRSRSALRHILAAHTGRPACDLTLAVDPGGKPRLIGGPHFNLSHSGEVMMLAVSAAGPVGIDVEREGRLDDDWRQVTRRAFSERERMQLQAMPEPDRAAAALRGWVRKEAYAKARGAGFAYGFTAFSVNLAAQAGDLCLIEDAMDAEAADVWRLHDLDAREGYAASLAHAGGGGAVRYRLYEGLPP